MSASVNKRFKPVSSIEVRIWGQSVGAVALDSRLGYYAFEYAPAFVNTGIELSPLRMPIGQADEPFVFTELSATFQRLPALLADALPDKFGNALINAWMAQHGVNDQQVTALDRLAYMGKRGLGALEFRPVRGATRESSTAIELSKLVNSARVAVSGEFTDDPHAEAALKQIISVGTSAGGARAKASVAWNPNTDEICAGQFDVEPGFEHWLLKFDGLDQSQNLGVTKDFGRVEYAYHLMARAAGITMSDCRLLEENGRAHFMTRRFDRDGNIKHHLQTLCGMDHLDFNQIATHDYNQFFMVLQKLELPTDAFDQAFRRMAFNVMAANNDDHTKNISFILRQNQGWALSPAYDITFSYDPRNRWLREHLMSVNGRFSDITRQDLLRVADRFVVPKPETILTTVRNAVQAWPDFAAEAGVSKTEQQRIWQHLRTL
jgi:serine/threonine-protein kinase HipA